MKIPVLQDSLESLEKISASYLAKHAPSLNGEEAAAWRPRTSLWSQLQKVTGWLPGIKARREEVDDHLIHFWQIGPDDGTPIVLIHGFGASKENWISLIPGLRRGHTLYVLDLPGFGQSTYIHSARYTYEQQAARLAQWAEKLELDAAHWVGSSMGGAICATLAAHFPERVRSLTLMNAAGMGSERMSPTEAEFLEGGNVLIPHNLQDVRRLFEVCLHRYNRLISFIVSPALHRDMTHRVPVSRHIFADMLQPEIPVPELLAQIQAPVHAIWGEKDRIVDLSCGQRYAQLLPNCRLEVLQEIGHLPMLEAPIRTARLMRQFWKELEEPQPTHAPT